MEDFEKFGNIDEERVKIKGKRAVSIHYQSFMLYFCKFPLVNAYARIVVRLLLVR